MKYTNPLTRRQFVWLTSAAAGSMMTAQGKLEDSRIASLKESHIGTLEIDLKIMNQYTDQPQEVLDFYTACRTALTGENPEDAVAAVCQKFDRSKLGGPMLGDVSPTGVAVWMRLPVAQDIEVKLAPAAGGDPQTFASAGTDTIHSVRCHGLTPDMTYTYTVTGAKNQLLGSGRFVTPPAQLSEKPFRIAFGTCYHKVGMYRPELMGLIRERGNRAMLVLGDSAVDGRKDDYGLIASDYLLRDLSAPWQQLTSDVPLSATWDDHDYWGDDTSGTRTRGNKPIDVKGLRQAWKTHWNNPEREVERAGIYFSNRIGPVQHIALDTRSCRVNAERGQRDSYLGKQQRDWLKQQIESSDADCILISSGTMWTDYISAGKDSWGTWDTEGREEIFQWIDAKQDEGTLVILLSGDRHGARGFAIPRPEGRKIYELEVACMGGVPGPGAHGEGREHQLFGYPGRTWAFGELTFSQQNDKLEAVFNLMGPTGKVMETVALS